MYSEPKLGSPANIFWIALTTIGVLAWCFGPQTWDWYQAKKMGEAQPCLRLGVQPMVVGDADVAPGTKETFFGYQFEVPWLSVEAKVFRQEATLISPHGSGILFWNPAERRKLIDDETGTHMHPNKKDAFGEFVGKDAARSDYYLLNYTISVTPEQIRPSLSQRAARQRLTLLKMKSVVCLIKISAFYSFQWQGLRCIQIGEPKLDRRIEIQCFDQTDREFNFHFSTQQDASGALTQAEINRVVQTLRPVEKTSVLSSEPATRNTN
jgi:hypothetical protein